MLGNRHSQHSFAQIPSVNIARSQFDRSFTVKDTFDFDYLVPIFVDEIIPGDTMNVNMNMFARLATQKVPIMDNMYIDYFFFFVPNRLVMTNWEKLNGAQTDPEDSTDFICPQLTFPANGPDVGTIYDKYGLPTDIVAGYTIKNSLPFRAYNLIWNEWFRDQNLQNSLTVPKDDGPDVPADFTLQKRNKSHDFFMSCLPWPQKGPDVQIPLAETAPVLGIGKKNQVFPTGPVSVYETGTVGTTSYADTGGVDVGAGDNFTYYVEGTAASGYPNIRVELGEYAGTINELREAFAMQQMFEVDALGGTRFTEILLAHYGVVSPDARLQRPEFLGSGRSRINIHPVAQTSPTSGSNYASNLSSFATASGSGIGFSKSFDEHGYVIGMACARADVTYQQGVRRLWDRSTRYDFFWPMLEQLGEQAVLNKEIYVEGDSSDAEVFGYQERFADYKYMLSEIHGQFRSSYSASLDSWHMAEDIGETPDLATMIEQFTPIERALADTNAPHLLCDYWFNYTAARRMKVRSTPAGLMRF